MNTRLIFAWNDFLSSQNLCHFDISSHSTQPGRRYKIVMPDCAPILVDSVLYSVSTSSHFTHAYLQLSRRSVLISFYLRSVLVAQFRISLNCKSYGELHAYLLRDFTLDNFIF